MVKEKTRGGNTVHKNKTQKRLKSRVAGEIEVTRVGRNVDKKDDAKRDLVPDHTPKTKIKNGEKLKVSKDLRNSSY